MSELVPEQKPITEPENKVGWTVRVVPMKRDNNKTGESTIVGYLPFVFDAKGFIQNRALGWSYLGTFATPEAAQAAYDKALPMKEGSLYRTYAVEPAADPEVVVAEPE